MTTLLWQKNDTQIDARVQEYLAGDDVVLDRHLLPYDIEATIAHVRGLVSIDALTADDAESLVTALLTLADLFQRGEFVLDARYEDGHSAIEAYLTEHLGPLGKKVHLGRSRNDQVLVAQRLFVRGKLDSIRAVATEAARTCLAIAAHEQRTPMPGYTHLQRAVPSTVGLWMAAFAEAFIDDVALLKMTRDWINTNPLGTAAGYGVNLPLDRDRTTELLAFERPQLNPMYAQNSRGKHEHQALSACWQVLQDVRRLGWDLTLFSATEFGFVRFGSAATTGSSIMPNKRNPDLAELMRAAVGPLAGCMAELQQILGLPSGYQRDLQLTKAPVIRGLLHTLRTVELVPTLLGSIEFDRNAMRDAIDADMHATDQAVDLAAEGVPFRDAYRQVADSLGNGEPAPDPLESIEARVSPGACGNLCLDTLGERLEGLDGE
jgi:argininosuccinate lyase